MKFPTVEKILSTFTLNFHLGKRMKVSLRPVFEALPMRFLGTNFGFVWGGGGVGWWEKIYCSIFYQGFCVWFLGSTLPETNMAPENRPSLKETNLPTIIISGAMLVSGSVKTLSTRCFSILNPFFYQLYSWRSPFYNLWVRVTFSLAGPQKGHENAELPKQKLQFFFKREGGGMMRNGGGNWEDAIFCDFFFFKEKRDVNLLWVEF